MTTPTAPTALRRTVASVAVLAALTTAFGAGFLVADGRGGQSASYRLTAAGLDSGLSCERVQQWYVEHAVGQVTAWGWQVPAYRTMAGPQAGVAEDAALPAPSTDLPEQTGSSTGTNVQEAGVDEPDVVKVSGDLLVRISGDSLKTDDVSGAEPSRLGVVPLDRIGNPQLLVAGDRAVVVGAEVEDPAAGAPLVPPPPRTWVRTYDLSDPSDPRLVDSRLYDGSVVAARQVGSAVRLVLASGPPVLDFSRPSSSVTEKQSLEHNRQVVRDSTAADWLPRVTTYDTATQGPFGSPTANGLVDCAGLSLPETFNGLGTLTVVGFDPATPDAADATAVATTSDTAYMSPTHLYVATSPWSQTWRGFGPPLMPVDAIEPTRIYGFDLSGTAARYVGTGSVDGTVAGSWSMDDHDGVLRVAVATSGSTAVVVLRPESGRLLDVGRLDGLGAGQQLKSVRWFDDLAVLVTFRQTDPFYVVDVADPTDPHVLGALHLPGWSSYLHPVGPHLVLGLGQTAPGEITIDPPQPLPMPPTRQHAKATLFDISDLAHPRDVDTVSYPAGSAPMAATDPHQVTWLPDRDTLVTVIGSGFGGSGFGGSTYGGSRVWVSVLAIHDGRLDDRLVPVATADPSAMRTLPLADGRVVLVAGDSVSFLAV